MFVILCSLAIFLLVNYKFTMANDSIISFNLRDTLVVV